MAYQKPGGGGVASDEVNATLANVLAGKTALTSDSNDEVGTGTMPNRGAVSQSIGVNGSYTIPEGYHNGSGVVNQSITTHSDSGNRSIGVNGSTSYPAGYYYNAHGAAQSITTYNDSGNVSLGVGASKSYPAGYYYNAHGASQGISAGYILADVGGSIQRYGGSIG